MYLLIVQQILGSISVSGQLPTFPSPNPTLTLTCCQLTVVELGEGQVGSCPDTDTDPNSPCQNPRKCTENSLKNMHTDIKGVKWHGVILPTEKRQY